MPPPSQMTFSMATVLGYWHNNNILCFFFQLSRSPDTVLGQLNMWQCQSVTHLPTFWFWNTKRHPRHLWPLRHLIRVMRKLDLTNKKTMTKTITNTLSEHNQMTILEKLWNYWYFWQLRTSRHYNHSELTIKTIQSDTGQHSQFLWLFTDNNSLVVNYYTGCPKKNGA